MVSNVEQKRNATSSWSGYIHQGKVGFLVALRQLRQCIENGIENFEKYSIKYESAEDFDIVDDRKEVLSRHQVKAYINGNEREDYSEQFNIQTRKFENGKEKIDIKGYQIHEFDGQGKIVRMVVSSESRYLHVITKVPDFYLTWEEYKSKFPDRTKYTKNDSQVQLYKYKADSDEVLYCPLSQNNDNDTIRDYCIAEMKEILKLEGNPLNDNAPHLKQVYLRYVGSLLDNSIGKAHSESGFPEITFGEIISIIEKEAPKDEVYEMKNTLTYSWEKYHLDYIDDISVDDFEQMDIIIKRLLSMSKEDFLNFSKMVLPNEKQNENLSKLFNNSVLENIFYVLLEKTKDFPFESYSYLDDDKKSYRISFIDIQNRRGRIAKLIQEIINNVEFLKATFNHDFLINRDIDDISINGTRVDELECRLETAYKDEWNTGVENNIFKPSMEFISINKIQEKNLNSQED